MKISIKIVLAALIFLAKTATAQTTGWQWIEKNNWVEAKTAFEQELKKNPTDEAALVGAMFIAETRHDHENYKKYANQLIRSTWKPEYLWLFGHLFDGTPDEILAQQDLNFALTANQTQALLNQADSLFVNRKFEESAAAFRRVVPDWQWLLAGPFSNQSGSGFVEKNAPETEPFDRAQIFKNEEGLEFGWLERRLFPPGSFVNFNRLPEQTGMKTYFAQTFLTNPTDREVQLRLTRHEPMKIWLDDQLLFELPRQAPQLVDFESFNFNLPKGTHRLLVKISEFPDEEDETKVALAFNDVADDSPDRDLRQRRGRSEGNGRFRRGVEDTEFLIRFCDPATGETLQDLVSSFNFDGKISSQPIKREKRIFGNKGYVNELTMFSESAPSFHRYFLAVKTMAFTEDFETGEALITMADSAFGHLAIYKFTLAKFYAANDKDDRAEALLSELDPATCPALAAEFLKLEKINSEKNEDEYLGQLERMLGQSPTNFGLMTTYLNKLKSKGKKEQVKGFVKKFLEENPSEKWRERLEDYLEDESYKPETYKPKTDKEREKEAKMAEKRLKKRFSFADYSVLLEFQKSKNRAGEVLKLHDELIRVMPWNLNRRVQKAKYLFEIGKLDDALALLQSVEPHVPFSRDVLETIGDIFSEKKQDADALAWYKRAAKFSDAGSLRKKIEKLEPPRRFDHFFEKMSFEDAMRDSSWLEKYRGEESVISFFGQQATFKKEEQRLEFSRKMVIHILNDAGAKSWTEADFRGIGRISSAKVLKKDGSVTSPALEYRTAVFKNLQAGDVILVEGFSEQGMTDEVPGEFLTFEVLSWQQAPVARSVFELLVPADLPLHFSSNRVASEPSAVRDTAGLKILKWQWQSIERAEREEASPRNLDIHSWLMIGSAADWSRVVEWYGRKTYCRTQPNYEVLAKARALVKPGMTQEQIVEAFHTFVTTEINYSFVPFLNTNYVPKRPGATLAGKVGDCKDVATLMISLLREQGIEAWYVLAETHSFSKNRPLPAIYAFNHAIVAYQLADGVLRFADLTTDYYPNGIVPEFDADAWGLVVRNGEKQLVRLPNHALDPTKSRVEIRARAELDSDENLILKISTENHGCPGGRWREELIPAAPADRRKLLSEYFGGGVLSHLDFEKIEFENLEKTNEPLRMRIEMQSLNQLDRVSNFWIMPLPLPHSTPTHRALFAAKRYEWLDVDDLFELAPVREEVELALPAGFSLLELPQNQSFESEFGKYELRFEAISGGVRVVREVAFRQRFVAPADFQNFKKFYLKMLDADDTKLALRKV